MENDSKIQTPAGSTNIAYITTSNKSDVIVPDVSNYSSVVKIPGQNVVPRNVVNTTAIINTSSTSTKIQTPSKNVIYNTAPTNSFSDNINGSFNYKAPMMYTDRSTFSHGMEVQPTTSGNVTETPINGVPSFNIHDSINGVPETSMTVQGTSSDNKVQTNVSPVDFNSAASNTEPSRINAAVSRGI